MDAINSEIRLIQQEKSHAERIAEQLENRARLGDMHFPGANTAVYSLDDSNLGNLSTRSTPRNSPQHDFLGGKYNTVVFLFLCLNFFLSFCILLSYIVLSSIIYSSNFFNSGIDISDAS